MRKILKNHKSSINVQFHIDSDGVWRGLFGRVLPRAGGGIHRLSWGCLIFINKMFYGLGLFLLFPIIMENIFCCLLLFHCASYLKVLEAEAVEEELLTGNTRINIGILRFCQNWIVRLMILMMIMFIIMFVMMMMMATQGLTLEFSDFFQFWGWCWRWRC